MPTSPEQDREIDRIIADSPEDSCRIRPNVGPDHDRAVLSFPSGRQVVLDLDGEVVADTAPPVVSIRDLIERDFRRDYPGLIGPDDQIEVEFYGPQQRGGEIVEALADRARRSDPPPSAGYDPACDLLIVERPDGESCLIAPWRCAMGAVDHAIPEYAANMRRLVGEWAENVLHRPLKVWVLARGETELREEGK